MAKNGLARPGVTVDLVCPHCETHFTVAATLVLDGGEVWCPGCRALTRGDDRVGKSLEQLRRGHARTLRQALAWGLLGDGGLGGATDPRATD